jgi:hypothetical protein
MLTHEDARNLLILVDRALKAAPQQGGLNDHLATAQLIMKLNALAKEATPDGKDLPPTD